MIRVLSLYNFFCSVRIDRLLCRLAVHIYLVTVARLSLAKASTVLLHKTQGAFLCVSRFLVLQPYSFNVCVVCTPTIYWCRLAEHIYPSRHSTIFVRQRQSGTAILR